MPPLKAGPKVESQAESQVESQVESQASLHPKRKLPDFITEKKRVRFSDVPSEMLESLDTVRAEWTEAPFESEGKEMLEQMYDVFKTLSDECDERRHSARADAGEIVGETPPTSQDSVNSTEFELSNSAATDVVESSEIFDFIWKYTPNHEKIYRRIGTGRITREMAEYHLRTAPRDLLYVLEIALVEAEKKV